MQRHRNRRLGIGTGWAIVLLCVLAGTAASESTITYSYDARHRLVQADYGEAGKQFVGYDAAGNVELAMSVTDQQQLRSFLLFLSMNEHVLPFLSLAIPEWPLWQAILMTVVS